MRYEIIRTWPCRDQILRYYFTTKYNSCFRNTCAHFEPKVERGLCRVFTKSEDRPTKIHISGRLSPSPFNRSFNGCANFNGCELIRKTSENLTRSRFTFTPKWTKCSHNRGIIFIGIINWSGNGQFLIRLWSGPDISINRNITIRNLTIHFYQQVLINAAKTDGLYQVLIRKWPIPDRNLTTRVEI